jgi:dephospho-CoA kinase
MLLVGLTGGLATGKTYVGRIFTELGCTLIQADELGHQTLAPDGEAYGPVVEQFGREMLDAAGRIDRRRLAAIVFNDAEQLRRLNAIVHPAVERLRAKVLETLPEDAIVIVEAAIHIETGGYLNYRKLILVVCDEELQIERAILRSGWTREEALARIRRQMPLEEKRKFADYVIDTSRSPSDTRMQTIGIYNQLRAL